MLISISRFGQRGPYVLRRPVARDGAAANAPPSVVLFSQGEYGENSITRLDGNIWILFCSY
ncbi:hypothetical protein ACCS96_29770, partial [Rhizobium ruizarguesonis]